MRRSKVEGLIPKELFKEKLSYNKVTGTLTWKQGSKHAGRPAGQFVSRKTNNYLWVGIGYNGSCYKVFAHRVVWMLEYGNWPDNDIDHIDGDGTNNKLDNLICVTRTDNNKNHALQKNNKSGLSGGQLV